MSQVENPVIALSPGPNHLKLVEPLLRSADKHLGPNNYYTVVLTTVNWKPSRKNVEVRKISQKDMASFERYYYAEDSRPDIGPFVLSQLLVPEYFCDFKHLLFMEVDQVFNKDIRNHYNSLIKAKTKLGAAPVNHQRPQEIPRSFQKLYPKSLYYNTGVVFYDTEYWLANSLTELCLKECTKQIDLLGENYNFYIQGAMNHGILEHFTPISWHWNLMGLAGDPYIDPTTISKALILHWNGRRKPWLDAGLYKDLYFQNIN